MSFEIVVVGTSLGGLVAVETLLEGLAADFPLPLAIVQHRSIESRDGLCSIIQKHSALLVREAEDKEAIQPGRVYLAPSDYHLLVEQGQFALSTQGPVSYARPSIDVLFESAADSYGTAAIGIILTGANHDGARGAARLVARGGCLIVQEPASAECAVMPQAALTAARPNRVVPLTDIAAHLTQLTQKQGDGSDAMGPQSPLR